MIGARPMPQNAPARAASRGFAAIAAIAILVILAALAAFIVSVSGLRARSTAIDVLGTRALQAAKAGIEWNMYLIQHPEDTVPLGTRFNCPGGVLANLTFGGTLSDFTVTVSCQTTTTFVEAGNNVWIHQIVAVACNFPDAGACPNNNAANTNPSYAERQMTALTETCRTASLALC